MPQFHETYIGKKTLDSNIPKLIRALERIADSLESINKKLGEEDKSKSGVPLAEFNQAFCNFSKRERRAILESLEKEDENIKRMDDIMPDGTVRGG